MARIKNIELPGEKHTCIGLTETYFPTFFLLATTFPLPLRVFAFLLVLCPLNNKYR